MDLKNFSFLTHTSFYFYMGLKFLSLQHHSKITISKHIFLWHPKKNNLVIPNEVFSKLIKTRKRFLILGLNIIDTINHSNGIVFDFKMKTIERYEPHGSMGYTTDTMQLDFQLNNFAKSIEYVYIPPVVSCPFESIQTLAMDTMGMCQTSTLYYFDQRLALSDTIVTPQELHKQIYLTFKKLGPKSAGETLETLALRVTGYIVKSSHVPKEMKDLILNYNYNKNMDTFLYRAFSNYMVSVWKDI